MKIRRGIVVFCAVLLSCEPAADQHTETETAENKELNAFDNALKRLSPAFRHEVEANGFPRCLEPDGTIRTVPSRDWTSGFFPGVLWYAYEYTDNEAYKDLAAQWTALMEQEKTNDRTHDMGFKINCSFGNGYRLTSNPEYQKIMIESAKTLSTRFDPEVGCIKSWDFNSDIWSFPVIIDNMMNLELLFLATQFTGDSSYYQIAYSHASTTLKNHFREDNSSYHVVDYNPESGEVISKFTHQGHSDESVWARGQAWGLYGYTMAYRFTQDEAFLTKAREIYEYIFAHPNLPEDLIPYWDYDMPAGQNPPRDVSAAAVTSSALYELTGYISDQTILDRANLILNELGSDKYLAKANADHFFILDHSTGNMPKSDEIDVPIIYADYYYMEALIRQKQMLDKNIED